MLQPVLLELLDRVVARVVALRLGRDDLVQELALAVLPARLDVNLLHRNRRLAEATAALRGEDDHAGARRSLQDELPLLLSEVGSPRHRFLLSTLTTEMTPAEKLRQQTLSSAGRDQEKQQHDCEGGKAKVQLPQHARLLSVDARAADGAGPMIERLPLR